MRLAAVILPDLGTGPDVPIVVSHWFVARGDQVWEGERLVEVLVGPAATLDVPSPVTGRLAEIHGWEDDRVEAGSVLGLVLAAEEGALEPALGAGEENPWGPDGRRGPHPRLRRPTP
jgi:pyruvate/2-oxoglutarate dehydrogenase complex dihydrolipoamide acyltransferase (E2) component